MKSPTELSIWCNRMTPPLMELAQQTRMLKSQSLPKAEPLRTPQPPTPSLIAAPVTPGLAPGIAPGGARPLTAVPCLYSDSQPVFTAGGPGPDHVPHCIIAQQQLNALQQQAMFMRQYCYGCTNSPGQRLKSDNQLLRPQPMRPVLHSTLPKNKPPQNPYLTLNTQLTSQPAEPSSAARYVVQPTTSSPTLTASPILTSGNSTGSSPIASRSPSPCSECSQTDSAPSFHKKRFLKRYRKSQHSNA